MHMHRNDLWITSRRVLLVAALLGLGLPVFAPLRSPAQSTLPAEESVSTQPTQSYKHGVIITIDSEISDVTYESIRRRLGEARTQGADLVIFRLDTPGGLVSSTLKICDLIKNMPEHTVAWINTKAYSGGAITALSCNEILMSRRSTIGDAQPIMMKPTGPQAIPKEIEAKGTSPLLEELRDSAQRNGYSLLLCEAMIRPDMEVFWVQNSQTGEKRFVTRPQRNELFGITTTMPAGTTQPVETSQISRTEWHYVESDPHIPDIRQPVVGSNELLTMTQNEAIAFGFAKPILVSNDQALAEYYGLAAVPPELPGIWSETMVAWLTSDTVRSALLLIAMLAGYMELNTPGLGLAGIVAVICLALFLVAPYLSGMADIWDILLVVAGIGLIAVELFILPGFGVAGVAGIGLLLVGLVATFVPSEWPNQTPFHLPSTEYAWSSMQNGIIAVSVALAGSLIGMILLSRLFPHMPLLNKLVLANPKPQEVSLEDWFGTLPSRGDKGIAIGPLRPAGKARFGSALADVVTQGEFIETDQPVEVLERVGNRVVVQQIKPASEE